MLLDHLEDSTTEAQSSFTMINRCTYANKSLGRTDYAMQCHCVENWGKYNMRSTNDE